MRSFLLWFLSIYLSLGLYSGVRILYWVRILGSTVHPAVVTLVLICAHLTVFFGRFIRAPLLGRTIIVFSNVWFGFFLVLSAIFFVSDVGLVIAHVTGFQRFSLPAIGRLVFACGFVAWMLATLLAVWLRQTEYSIHVEKGASAESFVIAVFSDLHLGTLSGVGRVNSVVRMVNAMEPDLVFIVGDLFDNDVASIRSIDAIATALSGIQAKYGVYACAGNHDVDFRGGSGIDAVVEFCKKANIQMLADQLYEHPSFTIIGRLDHRPIGIQQERKSLDVLLAGVDMTKPIFMLDHQPTQIATQAELGVDLTVCGHTHAGQVFPGRLVTRRMFVNDYGHLQIGAAHSVVTSGAWVWGPPIRFGTRSEVVKITVTFGAANA